MAYISPEIGLALARAMRKSKARTEQARERIHGRYADRETQGGPCEALQCPQCGDQFDFGYACPQCETALLPQGCGVEQPQRRVGRELAWALLSLGLLVGSIGVLAWMTRL